MIALRRKGKCESIKKGTEEGTGQVWCWLWLGLPNLSCRLDKCSVMRGVCTHGEGGSFWRLRLPVLRSLIQSRRHDVHINHTHWHEVRHTAQPGINSSPTHQQKKEDGHAQTTEDHKLYSLLKHYRTALHHLLHNLTWIYILCVSATISKLQTLCGLIWYLVRAQKYVLWHICFCIPNKQHLFLRHLVLTVYSSVIIY